MTPSAASETQHGSGDEDEDGEEVYGQKMVEIRDELVGLVRFVKDGLRGVARAGVMPHLELLAEELAVTGGEERDGY
jgi:gamma-tubulin complex component 5